jgi:ubiquitin-like protein Pup
MATRDTGDQQRVSRPADEVVEEAPATNADAAAAKEALDQDVDAILDEIDEVLEENAEDFVKSFVQKGGE